MGIRSAKRLRWLLAVLASFALLAAACGGDDDGDSATDDEGSGLEASGDDEAEEEEPEDEPEEEPAEEEEAAEEEAPAAPSIDAGDNGVGAEEMAAAISAALSDPQAADGEAISIGMINLEGSPGGSFPEIRAGAEAAIGLINDSMGGIDGRPIELTTCAHEIDPSAAQDCANQMVEADVSAIFVGVDFFTPGLYPIWAGIPVYNIVPIFVPDFDNPGAISFGGGCVVSFPGQMKNIVESGVDRLAVIYSDNAPGNGCWEDTQLRPLELLAEQNPGFEFQGFPEVPEDPADNDVVNQQVLDYLAGAENPGVQFGIAAPQCAEYWIGLREAGYEGSIYSSGSCDDDNALSQAGDAVVGVTVGFTGYSERLPELWQDNELIVAEVELREQTLDAFGGDTPDGTFKNAGFSTMMTYYMALSEVAGAGGDPGEGQSVFDQIKTWSGHHSYGSPPIDCGAAPADYESICDYTIAYGIWNGTGYDLAAPHVNNLDFVASLPPREG
jgi:ABC-type branched-subunit amino acid transport system substrate-binding protein